MRFLTDNLKIFAYEPDIIVVALRLHVVAPDMIHRFASLTPHQVEELSDSIIARQSSFLDAIRKNSTATILVHNFERPHRPAFGFLDRRLSGGQIQTIDALNRRLSELVESVGGFVVDIDGILSRIGYDQGLDDRFWHLARAPYSLATQFSIAESYASAAAALKGKAKKCLVLDCDNTLWGGVIGEDGLAGIKLGASAPGSAFVEFQAAILDLYHRGILLAINSKNNEQDAMEVFEQHPQSLLKPHHFVAKRINWNDKASNLREIAAELNIGIDSLVFVDDNPVECRLVKERVPEVVTIELPRDPSRYARVLKELPYFNSLNISDEDRRRSEMYRSASQRKDLQSGSASMDEFLASLKMRLKIGVADEFSIPRIAQLTQKTNQFNLTTRRYSEADVRTMSEDVDMTVLFVELCDMFDDLGIIAVAIVEHENDRSRIDTFLMSCRVIGRGVEQALLSTVADLARDRGYGQVVGEFLLTAKNSLVKGFFLENGFEQLDAVDTQWWRLVLADRSISPPKWFHEILQPAKRQV